MSKPRSLLWIRALASLGVLSVSGIALATGAGVPYEQLGAEWYQWALQAPAADNPLLDTTGAKCTVGQQGPVWFLAGVLGEGSAVRRCTVPGGKALYLPILNVAWLGFLSDPPEQRTLAFIREQIAGCANDSIRDVSVKVDGVRVATPPPTSGEKAPPFQVQLPTDNIFGATTDDIPKLLLSPSVQKGLYLYVKPLTPGRHKIQWKGAWDCGSQDITYYLTVLPGVSGLVK